MSTVLYTVTCYDALFDGYYDSKYKRVDEDCLYAGDDREKAFKLARTYSNNDLIEVNKNGISRCIYKLSEFEIENDEIICSMTRIFDVLDRFKTIKNFAERARSFKCDVISYIVGDREWIESFTHNGHVCDLYRYTNTAFGDFTAYRELGLLRLPEDFNDYGIMNAQELMLAKGEGVKFWQDWEVEDPEMKLLYCIFSRTIEGCF